MNAAGVFQLRGEERKATTVRRLPPARSPPLSPPPTPLPAAGAAVTRVNRNDGYYKSRPSLGVESGRASARRDPLARACSSGGDFRSVGSPRHLHGAGRETEVRAGLRK
jgi:hypothetical protein